MSDDESSVAGPSSSSKQPAKSHPLPTNQFYAIEFPGVLGENPESVRRAIQHLGGPQAINRAFKRNASKVDSLLELSWRPGNPFAHPVAGGVVSANNVLLKVRKRKRRRRDGQELLEPEGEFVAEAVGVIPKTVRFRGMADFQYNPDDTDPVVQFRSAMDRMDVEYIRNYSIPPEKEDYEVTQNETERSENVGESEVKPRSNLRLIPPPIFSRQTLPQIYNYKANNMSVITTVIDQETGEEKKRLINRSRWKGYGPACIPFSEKTVPLGPPEAVVKGIDEGDKRIIEILKKKFEDRPCWTKVAIVNQFNAGDARELNNSKHLLPSVSYVFVDGPWRDTLLRFGYDPRTDPSGRFYQRLYFRNLNHVLARPSVLAGRQESRNTVTEKQEPGEPMSQAESASVVPSSGGPPSHIFDGTHLTKETAAFQLCDITDPMIQALVQDNEGLRDECNERDGWYTTQAIERIKTVLRHKFFALTEGHIPSDEECRALLETSQDSRANRRPRFSARKHNMAKGAVPPEDAAAVRLRATLNNAARGALSKNR